MSFLGGGGTGGPELAIKSIPFKSMQKNTWNFTENKFPYKKETVYDKLRYFMR